MSKVFVGNFSFAIDDEKLREFFSQAGSVLSAKVMKEGHGGRSRGFGFVEFASQEEAQEAIKKFDGTVWEGRVIKVSEDRSTRRESSPASEGEHSSSSSEEGGYSGRSSAPMGYFKAQPLDVGFRRKKKMDPFVEDTKLQVDYKDPKLLTRFVSERGRVLPRRMTGLSAHHQRMVTRAIKRAQHLALMPYVRG